MFDVSSRSAFVALSAAPAAKSAARDPCPSASQPFASCDELQQSRSKVDRCRSPKFALAGEVRHWRGLVYFGVGEIVAVRASRFIAAQLASMRGPQHIQQEVLGNSEIPYVSRGVGIWFGIRRPVVPFGCAQGRQIHSPQPFLSARYPTHLVFHLHRCGRFYRRSDSQRSTCWYCGFDRHRFGDIYEALNCRPDWGVARFFK